MAALQRLDGTADAASIERLALDITGHMLHLKAAQRARGHDIGSGDDGFYARPRAATAGLSRELRDIAATCRKAVAGKITWQQWVTAWAALPNRTKAKVWKPALKQTKRGRTIDRRRLLGFSAPIERRADDLRRPGCFGILAPRPQDVLSDIEAALLQITARPQTKARKADANEADAIAAVRRAYQAITGYKGSRAPSPSRGKLSGRFIRLGREIDAIFGTALFAASDTSRL